MSMTTYMVSLYVRTTRKMSGKDICNIIGVTPHESSYWKEESDHWEFESQVHDEATFDEHIIDLSSIILSDAIFVQSKEILSVTLFIGLFWDVAKTPDGSIKFSKECLQIINEKWPGIDIEIISYPCEEES